MTKAYLAVLDWALIKVTFHAAGLVGKLVITVNTFCIHFATYYYFIEVFPYRVLRSTTTGHDCYYKQVTKTK